jgi:hypothetical protein
VDIDNFVKTVIAASVIDVAVGFRSCFSLMQYRTLKRSSVWVSFSADRKRQPTPE